MSSIVYLVSDNSDFFSRWESNANEEHDVKSDATKHNVNFIVQAVSEVGRFQILFYPFFVWISISLQILALFSSFQIKR